MDPNWIIAILGISAILSPTITTWLNNKHQLKLKQLEVFEKNKLESIEKFTKAVEYFYIHRTVNQARIDFEASVANLFIYFSIPNNSLFDDLRDNIDSNDYDETQFTINKIVRVLSSQLSK